jgi:hypothetical protein
MVQAPFPTFQGSYSPSRRFGAFLAQNRCFKAACGCKTIAHRNLREGG